MDKISNNYEELKKQAKELGISPWGMKKTDLREAIFNATIGIVSETEQAQAPEAPPKTTKKAGATWTWRNRFTVKEKDPNFRYRFVDLDENNLRDKLDDGWVFVHPTEGITGEHVNPKQVADGDPLDGVQTYRDMALMALPEELGQARDAAVKERTRAQTVGLKDRLKQDLARTDEGGAAPHQAEVHGKITIVE